MTILGLSFAALLTALLGIYFVALGLRLQPIALPIKTEQFIKIAGSGLLIFAGNL